MNVLIGPRMICREATFCFAQIRRHVEAGQTTHNPGRVVCAPEAKTSNDHSFAVIVYFDPADLSLPLSVFSEKYVVPAMFRLAEKIPKGAEMSEEADFAVPVGVQSDIDVNRGVAIRCVMAEYPAKTPEVPKKWLRIKNWFYVDDDKFHLLPVGHVLRFDVKIREKALA